MYKVQIEKYMNEALKEAKLSLSISEIPVGAIVVDKNGNIIGKGHNTREGALLIHGHAEINAINEAIKSMNSLKLPGCSLFVTLEPCSMCAGAILASGISEVFFGADSPDNGALGGNQNILPPRIKVFGGILASESESLISEFFCEMRKK